MNKHQLEDIRWQELIWQRPIALEAVFEMLTHLAALSPRGAVALEVRGCRGSVRYLLGADRKYSGKIAKALSAHGDIKFYDFPDLARGLVTSAKRLKISHPSLSLNTNMTLSVVRAGLAAMAAAEQECVLQVILGGSFAPSAIAAHLPDPNASWLEVLLGKVEQAAPEVRKSAKEKAEQHSFQAAIRIGASGRDAAAQLHAMLSALKTLESAGVRIRAEEEKAAHLTNAQVPWHFPSKLSVKELSNFLMLPVGEEELPGTPKLHPKLILPPEWYRSPANRQTDRSFACDLNRAAPKRLSISPRDSLQHTALLGPTGSGKSTAMLHLILADINAGRGVLVIDPKADLVNDVLARIPAHRADDVVVLDPSDACPVGFNPLAYSGAQNAPLVADSILGVFKELWADSWGVRIQDILSASLLTLAEIKGASLLWLPALLTDEQFRQSVTGRVKDKVALQPFWQQFENLKEHERGQHIAPVLNKLRQFLLRPSLRSVLGQSAPKLDLAELYTKRKIILVPLNKGLVGGEVARLLGSMVVGLTWVLALGRASLPPEQRHIVSLYVDELQDYLSFTTDLTGVLTQARGLGLGLTLAHQYRDQLPPNIRAAIDANAHNKIVFGLNGKDAKDMAAMAPELTQWDFMRLERYGVYCSILSGGKSTGWVRGKTLPPPPALRDAAELKARSQVRYGKPAEEVEAEYLHLLNDELIAPSEWSGSAVGRRKRL